MPQNIYSLPELIDLALRVPEIGAVNFNILHTVLQSIVKELNLTDVRPWCHVESPLLAKTALTQARFKVPKPIKIPAPLLLPEILRESEKEDKTITQETDEDTVFEKNKKELISLPSKEKPEEKSTDGARYPTAGRKGSVEEREEIETSKQKSAEIIKHPTTEKKQSIAEIEKVETSKQKSAEMVQHPTTERNQPLAETEEVDTSEQNCDDDSVEQSTNERKESTVQVEEKESKITDVTSTLTKEISEPQDDDTETEKMELENLPIDKSETSSEITEEKEDLENFGENSSDEAFEFASEFTSDTELPTENKVRDDVVVPIPTEEISETQGTHAETEIIGADNVITMAAEMSIAAIEEKLDDSIPQPPKTSRQSEMARKKIVTVTPGRGTHPGGDKWQITNLSKRVRALEEGLNRLSNIVDRLADQIAKGAGRRREGGPSDDLDFDERLSALEDALAQMEADHRLLMELRQRVKELLEEFEEIKALAALLKQMELDISKKADKEETWAALDMKADVELVNSKVDRWEFELAIEELGEAIGLLGLKFRRKNDEWEERAAEIWKAIDSKMTFDVFEAARIKIESRLTALMYGLRKLKKVIEDLLYPEASGVTRCILCRRPACISGLECMEGIRIGDSPKRPLSAEDIQDSQKIRKTLNDAIAKRQKLEAPPYCESPDTIIRIPYKSASYRSAVDDKEPPDGAPMKLQSMASNRGSVSSRNSQVPKLPEIDIHSSKSSSKTVSVTIPKTKPRAQKSDLYFTKKMLSRAERRRSSPKDGKQRFTAVTKVEPTIKEASVISSKSPASSVDLTPDPAKIMKDFVPARRRILLSPSTKEKPDITLAPLKFDS